MKKSRVGKFLQENYIPILLGALVFTTTTTVLQSLGIRSLNQYLKEKDLYEDYYTSLLDSE